MRNSLFIFLLALSSAAFGEPDANSLLQAVRDRDDGHSYSTHVTLKMVGSDKRVRQREFYSLQKDFANGEERILMAFHKPSDVRGVSFLVNNYDEHQAKEDDQWMYLPAFRKVRRLGSNDKRGSFMGSVFNYSDLDKVRVNDYTNTLVREEMINDRPAWLIERIPVSQKVINKTSYHKVHMWIDKERHIILQQHHFNAKGIVFKTQKNVEFEKIQGIWTIVKSVAENLENQKSSQMIFYDTVYNIDISKKKFNKQHLKKGIKASEMPIPNTQQ